MKTRSIWIMLTIALALSLASATLIAQNGKGRANDGWGAGNAYWRLYNTNSVETLTGKVIRAEEFTSRKGMSNGYHIILKTDQEEISVHLGPAWYINNQDEKIAVGDEISVTGSRVEYEGKTVIMAAGVSKGEDEMILRQDDGFPVWAGWRRGNGKGYGRGQGKGIGNGAGHGKGMGRGNGHGQGKGAGQGCCNACESRQAMNSGEQETISGKIVEVQRVDARKNNFKGIHLLIKNGAEELQVQLGPEWYMAKENAVFQAGEVVEVVGVRNTYEGKPAILATTIRRGNDSWTLRDEQGFPAWRGWRQGARPDNSN